ncbi:hypothetical protein HELRODRAFT_161347 [Helobdella robusta]|uniref:BRCT domain-containing protein n=1 Tax=Helobdella robusta TaxID=6412 RepID=T1ERD3_HELRO|nr:hypothetical protein HELRODRAFT_161347 [Helobdella robusta]ESO02111.1 hypothetical protein HELRODRAFT_161347 [Helobdella robusta]
MFKIYILPTGICKARTMIFERNVLKLGGVVHSSFKGGETTHVVADDQMDYQAVCSLLTSSSTNANINNGEAPFKIVKSKWLSVCIDAKKFIDCNDFVICNAKIPEEVIDQHKIININNKNDRNLHKHSIVISEQQESDYSSDEEILFENSIPNHVFHFI